MSYENKVEIPIGASIGQVEAELLHFYHQNGGDVISPFIIKIRNEDKFINYAIFETESDEKPDSSIVIRSEIGTSKSTLIIYLWDAENWGFQIDNPHKGVIGGQFVLAKEKSIICTEFCELFIEHITAIEFPQQGVRGCYEENEWAIQRLVEAKDFEQEKPIIFSEWCKKREENNRFTGATPLLELFRQSVIKKAQKIRNSARKS